MQIEKLLAKFNVRGTNHERSMGDKVVLSLDDHLAVVGVTWKESPVGFMILLVEFLEASVQVFVPGDIG